MNDVETEDAVSVVAAMVWTYWMAFPILAVTLLVLVTFGGWYLKRVVEPPASALGPVAIGRDGGGARDADGTARYRPPNPAP